MVAQKVGAYVQTINVGVAHMFKHGLTFGMFYDGAPEDNLVSLKGCNQNTVAPVSSSSWWCTRRHTAEGLVPQVGSNTFIFLGDFHIDCFDELAFGLGEGLDRLGKSWEEGL